MSEMARKWGPWLLAALVVGFGLTLWLIAAPDDGADADGNLLDTAPLALPEPEPGPEDTPSQ